ncbi:DUF1674 domain-containing protein [Dokdonella sp.]|uniref:DUF1674 domain-containing protein n=1 Tax=Dokdonella sp. TaxID=2291710 RepID=UPI003C6B8289
MSKPKPHPDAIKNVPAPDEQADASRVEETPEEIGGRGGLDPVRYGDWEKDGRCIDFRDNRPGF